MTEKGPCLRMKMLSISGFARRENSQRPLSTLYFPSQMHDRYVQIIPVTIIISVQTIEKFSI